VLDQSSLRFQPPRIGAATESGGVGGALGADVLRLDGVAADVLERIGVGIRRISPAGLEQQNRAGRVLTEAACHDTTGRASAHDDDAEGCSRGFLVRPEIHSYDI
jgi:hypothetical protein